MTKNEIRTLMKNKRDKLTVNQRNKYNLKIQDRLYDLEEFKGCSILFSYVSFGSEADTIAIIKTAFQMNKRVFIPKVEDKYMNFYEIHSLDGLVRSKFGILEPAGNDHKYISSQSKNDKKLMLLPGLAFDKSGNRIGYGAGYYDRYLRSHPMDEWIKVALAYDFQIMEYLPVTEYDIRTDYIITNEAKILC